MTGRLRLLILDAPGGPLPAQYLPSLLEAFEVHVVWLAVEPPARRAAREEALRRARTAVAVADPAKLPRVAARVARERDVQGVLSLSERTVSVAQRLAVQHGLSANPPMVIEALRDKVAQRRRLHAAGVPGPALRVLRTEQDCASAARELRLPAVLKPAIGMGSLATFLVSEPGELAGLWRRARSLVDADLRTAHLAPPLLLEEELRNCPSPELAGLGDYVSVDTLTACGRTHVLAVADKLPLSPQFRENGHLLPTIRTGTELTGAVSCALRAQHALGVTFGVCHTEVKRTPDGWRVIEVNGRPGGSVPEMLRLVSGYDLSLQLARLSCGLPPDTTVSARRHAGCLTPQPPSGRHQVQRAPGPADVLRLPGVATIYHMVRPGDVVDSDIGTASNLFRLTAVADQRRDLLALRDRVLGLVEFAPVTATHPRESSERPALL